MPMYTELQNAVVLDSSAGDNICSSYMEQILTQPATRKSTAEEETAPKKIYGPSKAVRNYLDYRERMQSKVMDINDNMSNLLKESFESIDNICNRVRSYLNANECALPIKNADSTKELSSQSSYELQMVNEEADENQDIQEVCNEAEEGMSVIEELFEESSRTLTPVELAKTQAEEAAEMKKIQWLHKQKEFTEVFKSSMKNIESFVADMNKYVEDVNNRINALTELPIVNGNKRKANYKTLGHLKKQVDDKAFVKQIGEMSDSVLTKIDVLEEANKISVGINKPHIIPDVKSAKAISDLNQHLKMQVEAKDSYVCFRRLMKHSLKRMVKEEQNKKPIPPAKPPQINSLLNKILKKGSDLTKMFDDSLWFSHKSFKPKSKAKPLPATTLVTKTHKTKNKEPNKQKKGKKKVPRAHSIDSCENKRCNILVKNENVAKPDQKTKVEWVHAKLMHPDPKTKKYRDILDDVSKADVMPLKSEYPRKDDVNTDPTKSFLFQLTKDSTVLQKLLIVDGKKSKRAKNNKQITDNVQPHPSFADVKWQAAQEETSKTEVIQKLKPYIFSDFSQQSVIVMPVTVQYNNPPMVTKKQPQEKINHKIRSNLEETQTQMLGIVKKLYSQQKQGTPRRTPEQSPLPKCKSSKHQANMERRKQAQESATSAGDSPTVGKGKKRERRTIKVSKLVITTSDEDSQHDKGRKHLGCKRKKMLDHLHGLKQKNDKFKGKIQEVIDVIECKMVDILSSPQQQTIDAFDAMEKEITNVLKMMKTEKPDSKQGLSDTSTDISEELYKKLQDLLDTPHSHTSIEQDTKEGAVKPRNNNKKTFKSKRTSESSPSELESRNDLTSRIKDLSISSLNDSEQISKLRELSNSIRVAHEHIQEICDEELTSLPSLHTKHVTNVTPENGKVQKVVIFKQLGEDGTSEEVANLLDVSKYEEMSKNEQQRTEDLFESEELLKNDEEEEGFKTDLLNSEQTGESLENQEKKVCKNKIRLEKREEDKNSCDNKTCKNKTLDICKEEHKTCKKHQKLCKDKEDQFNQQKHEVANKVCKRFEKLTNKHEDEQKVCKKHAEGKVCKKLAQTMGLEVIRESQDVCQNKEEEDLEEQFKNYDNQKQQANHFANHKLSKIDEVSNTDGQQEQTEESQRLSGKLRASENFFPANDDTTIASEVLGEILGNVWGGMKEEDRFVGLNEFATSTSEEQVCKVGGRKVDNESTDDLGKAEETTKTTIDNEETTKTTLDNEETTKTTLDNEETTKTTLDNEDYDSETANTDNGDSTWLDDTIPDLDLTSIDSMDFKDDDDESTSKASSFWSEEEEKLMSQYPAREVKFIENVMEIIQEVDEDSTMNGPTAHQTDSGTQKDFSDNMDEIFQKLELVYKKLDDGDASLTKTAKVTKDKSLAPSEDKGDDKLGNIYQLLDTLNSIVEEGPTEVYTAREVFFTQVWYRPVVFEHVKYQYQRPLKVRKQRLTWSIPNNPQQEETSFYQRLLTQTIDYFNETIQDPKMLTPLKQLENFLDHELYTDDLPKTLQQLDQLKTTMKEQQQARQTDDFHAKLLKLFYALFYIFVFLAMNFHYTCA